MTYCVFLLCLLIIVVPTNETAQDPCEVFRTITRVLQSSHFPHSNVQHLMCLAALHDFDPKYLATNGIPGTASLKGMLGLNSFMLLHCNSSQLSTHDEDLTDDIMCYLTIKRKLLSNHFSTISRVFCDEPPMNDSILRSVKYDALECNNISVYVPSVNAKRLYKMMNEKNLAVNFSTSLKYEDFSANIIYYDGKVYTNFFLERSEKLWDKLKKTLYDLKKRPIRLSVLLVIFGFITLQIIRFAKKSYTNIFCFLRC